jgi:simple sugar transport system permease protein
MTILVPLGSALLALVFGAVFFTITGQDALQVYATMFHGVFGSRYGITETIVKTIPLALSGLGLALAFRMQLWNIGGEGQIYLGAWGATWVALTFADAPAWFVLPAMALAAMVMGGFLAALAAIPRALWKTNEIITTLMLNYVAILWVDYFVYGPWRDPAGFNFPLTAPFSAAARLPALTGRIHAGLLIVLVLGIILYFVLYRTRWGFEVRVIGESEGAARYAGMNITRNIILVMLVSGAICGLTGMVEMAGVAHRLQPGFSPGYGFTAIIVAWLARLNPLAIVPVAFLFGGLQVGGYAVQVMGIPSAIVSMLLGSLLFFVLAGEALLRYRIRRITEESETR